MGGLSVLAIDSRPYGLSDVLPLYKLGETMNFGFSFLMWPRLSIKKSNQKSSDTGTRTRVSCVKGKYANHLHHIGSTKFGEFGNNKAKGRW